MLMRALADLIVKKSVAWAVVLAVLALAVGSPFLAVRLQNDDNLLAFLPRSNPDVKTFREVSDRFGALDIALVGIRSEDPLAPEFVGKLKALTRTLNETKDVDYALSLTSVEDFQPDPRGGIGVDYLVREPPKDAAEAAALREKVMSRDQVVGNLISADGKAALVYCFLRPGADPKPTAQTIRTIVEGAFPSEPKYWGGGPFIQSYIYGATEADLRKLTPWACVVIIVIAVASFRDALGSVLALFSTGVGIVVALAIMAACHVKANLVLGSMPVILFSLGSAYPIHLLTRYYTTADEMGCEGALRHALEHLGPVIMSTGFVTISGLLSFLAMDMEPMRTFGLFTAIGVFVTLVLAVTFVPAVVRLVNLKGKRSIDRPTGKLILTLCTMAQARRRTVGLALGAVALAGAFFMSRLDTRLDNSAFFAKNSPPAEAEAFLRDSFGGSQFFQVQIEGDMSDPAVLREVRGFADRAMLLPHVTSVNHVGVVIAKMNEAMDGDERIPDTGARVKSLYQFLEGKKAVKQFVTADLRHALVVIKVDTDRAVELEDVQGKLQTLADTQIPKSFVIGEITGGRQAEIGTRVQAMVLARIQAASRQFGVPLDASQVDAVARRLRERGWAADPAPLKAAILAYMRSDEFTGDLPTSPADAADRVAAALASLRPRSAKTAYSEAIAKALERPEGDAAVADLTSSLFKPVDQIIKRQGSLAGARKIVDDAHLAAPAGPKGQRFLAALGNALTDLDVPGAALPSADGPGKLDVRVTGLPVLNRGLSRSVAENQIESFVVAMGLVFVIALYLYRSAWSALLALSPMALTLLVVYGGMGLFGVRLDIGTSMLASLSIGAGVDYAVHLLAAWKAPESGSLQGAATYASFLVGRAIWTNAVMVAAGFLVLTMGEARPLQNVGGLTAAAMLAAGLATFAVIPVLARRPRYDERPRIAGISPADRGEGAYAPYAPVGRYPLQNE